MPRKRTQFPKKNTPKSKSIAYQKAYRVGTLSVMRSGRAFVEYSPEEKDIEIAFSDLLNAMHGDRVKVEILSKNKVGRAKGKVIEVIERKRKFYIGGIEKRGKKYVFNAESSYPLPIFNIELSSSISFSDGDKVVAEWLRWDDEKFPQVKIIEQCNYWTQTKLVYHQILFEKNFGVGFSEEVVQEASSMKITTEDLQQKERQDFREVFTFTIDPTDAKDFDDAISFRSIEEGLYEVGVHIADVTHFLKSKTSLDDEAYKRATSVYMPGYVEPMLPEALSNHLCSLVPHEDRLCFAVIFQITKEAKIKQFYITKTSICSNHRFTYDEVQEILDKKEGEHFPILGLLNTMAQHWRKDRIRNGSIAFASTDRVIVLDDTNKVVGIEPEKSNDSHQLIEEFMLMANQYVASFIAKGHKEIPFPSRIHDLPDEKKVKSFVDFAKIKGYTVSSDKHQFQQSLNKMLTTQTPQNQSTFAVLQSLAIRSMAKAEYSTSAIGHYGLGFAYYAHFTSPIRRYPDVMLHRILQSILAKSPMKDKTLEEQCKHCNERERAAMEAEREAKKYKLIEYIQPYVGSEMDAVITGVSDRGIWAELTNYYAEGFVNMEDLMKVEPFECLPEQFCVKGLRSGRKLELGNLIRVKIITASLTLRKIDLQWIT